MAIDVGELRAVLTLNDQFTAPIKKASGEISSFSGAFKAASAVAASVTAVIAGTTAAIVALGQRGAAVADVKGQFDTLAGGADSARDVLAGLQRGVVGTMSDFDLMATANKAMGAGLLKTAADAETLSAGARLLAKRTGGDTSEAFEKLTSAMASGRTASLKQLGLFVDGGAAAEAYAKSIGKSVSDLSDQEKAQALSAATLKALNMELRRTPADAADFGELIEQGKVHVSNFTDSLGVAISTSPVILKGLQSMSDGFAAAFGGDKSTLVQTLMGYVNDFAIGLTWMAQGGVEAGRFLTNTWYGLDVAFKAVMAGLFMGIRDFLGDMSTLVSMGESIPGVGDKFAALSSNLSALSGEAGRMSGAFVKQGQDALDSAAKANGAFNSMSQGLARTRGEMEALAVTGATAQATLAAGGPPAVKTINDQAEAAKRLRAEYEASAEAWLRAGEQERRAGEELAAWREQYEMDRQLLSAEGVELILLQQLDGYNRALDEARKFAGEDFAIATEVVTKLNALHTQKAAIAVAAYMAEQQAALATGRITQAAYDEQAKKAEESFAKMLAAGLITQAGIQEAVTKANGAMGESHKTHSKGFVEQFNTMSSAATSVLRDLFGKNKAAMISAVIIETAAAAISSFKNAGGFPWGIAPAAAMVAAGAAQLSKIQSQTAGFRFGTPGTEFRDFGTGTQAILHGREAVVNETQANSMAGMIEGAIRQGRSGPSEDRIARLEGILEGMRSDMRTLLPIAMRDAMLTARGLA